MLASRSILLAMLALHWAGTVAAFEIDGSKWQGATAELYIDLAGTGGSGKTFNDAFLAAVQQWNSQTPFSFSVVPQHRNPCFNDGINGVDFSTSYCGSEFGDKTLALTVRRYQVEVLGPPSIVQADIVINQNEMFNVYDGNLIQPGVFGFDLTRIAIHELGHALGLNHSNVPQAIMAPTIGNLFTLTDDDIAGVTTLYSGLNNCTIKAYSFGVIHGALDTSDCTVNALTLGNNDSSPIDLYQFDIANTTTFDFTMTSASLDSVLLVADENLRVLAFDAKAAVANGTHACDSTLSTTLQPGHYFLLANTYDVPAQESCGIQGNYQISSSISSNSFLSFSGTDSLTGGPAFGAFSGGISADDGSSYGNRFHSTDSIDIQASIAIDPAHQGQPGFLVVAALFDGAIHLLDANGQFVVFGNDPGVLPKARSKLLAAQEDLAIVSDLVPASLGISAIEVDFVVGYGVDSAPNEVYFHSTPLNLSISP